MEGKTDVLIVGAGVAGLEAAFALRALAGGEVTVTVLAPEAEFVYWPLPADGERVVPQRCELGQVIADAGAERVADAFRWLDAPHRVVHTRAGREIGYDALLLALGARRRPAFKHAVTIDPRRLEAQVARLVADVEQGAVSSVAALVPSRSTCPLPVYELSLLLARRAHACGAALTVTLATPEETPLAVFGEPASAAVTELLDAEGINAVTSVSCEVLEPGRVSLRPGTEVIEADLVLAQPQLFGPSTPGLPKRARGGFLSVDQYGKVARVEGVYAAGDATAFPVKFAGVAAQQADSAASAIAAAAGAPVEPAAQAPVINGVLCGSGRSLYLTAQLVGRHGARSEASATAPRGLRAGIDACYLGHYLHARARAATG